MQRFASKKSGNIHLEGSRGSLQRLWLGVIGALLSSLAVLCSPGVASASPVYGYFLITYYEFESGCQGCHETALGGAGTVTQPFGQTMVSLGLMGNNDYELLLATLNKLGASDSDGDGAPDVDEIVNRGDPNDPTVLPEVMGDSPTEMPAAGDPAAQPGSNPDTAAGVVGTEEPAGSASTDPAPPGTAPPGMAAPASPPATEAGCGVSRVNGRSDGVGLFALAVLALCASLRSVRRRSPSV